MSAQRLSDRSVRRIKRSTGLEIWRAWSHGGYDMEFVTVDHRHGIWNKVSGVWGFLAESEVVHCTTCGARFLDGT